MISYASTLDEAKVKYQSYKSKDPLSQIKPALLNSADICDYVAATGMIHPFDCDDRNLKPASYAIRLEGDYVAWDRDGTRKEGKIKKDELFILESNSIAFVSLEPFLQLPDYIAARFNLKISNVYRGLLLGTGPLVDPGFVGYLSLPLHNLTTNEYVFRGGEEIIWMEFTKLSENNKWFDPSTPPLIADCDRIGKYVDNPIDRINIRKLSDLLLEADRHRPIRSSIPKALFETSSAASEAVKHATSIARRFNLGMVSTAFALLFTLGGYMYYMWNIQTQTASLIRDAQDKQSKLIDKIYADNQTDIQVNARLLLLSRQVDSLSLELQKLEVRPK